MTTTLCDKAGECGGCAWIGRPWDAQQRDKVAAFAAAWRAAGLPGDALLDGLELATVAHGGLRDRTDLSFRRTPEGGAVLGLYDLDGARIVDVGPCPALSPALRDWLARLQDDPLPAPIERASLRLRVAPDGTRGLWLDLAHVDVKALFDEGAWLRRRLEEAVVELGQRRKPLYRDAGDDRLRLSKAPELRAWFETPLGDGRMAPLYGPVGGFSQPSLAANRVLVERTLALCRQSGATRWLELGAGNGNFTLPLLAAADPALRVRAVEMDPLARQGLERSATELGLADRLELRADNMHRTEPAARRLLEAIDAVLADPPRSGLRGFVDVLASLEPAERPRHLVYVSCYAESLVEDCARLASLGYHATSLAGVDQFPQSPHAEWLAALRRVE